MSHTKVFVIGVASARIEGWCTYCVRRAWAQTTEAMPFPRKIESQDYQAQAISVDWFVQQLSLRAQWGGHCYHTEHLIQGNMRFTMTYGAKLKSNKRKLHLDIQSTLIDSAELKFDQDTSPVRVKSIHWPPLIIKSAILGRFREIFLIQEDLIKI